MAVLLLRVTGEPHAVISDSRALALAQTGRAVTLAAAERPMLTAGGERLERPLVLSLTRHVPTGNGTPRWTKRGVLARDGGRCAYCGGPARTVDHVYPRHLCLAEGRKPDTWQNTVAACEPCQARKGGATMREAGMRFRAGFTPVVPRRHSPAFLRAVSARPEWREFLRHGG